MHDAQKLYIVTRRDLAPGMQVAQSVHAAFEFAKIHPLVTEAWMEQSNNICVLAVDDETQLAALYIAAKFLHLDCVEFREPDLDDEMTAIAIEPNDVSQRLVRDLDLALNV